MTKYIYCTKDQQGNCIRLLASLLRMVTCWRQVVEQVFFPFVERQVETSKVSIKENFSQCNAVAQTSQCEGAACGEDTRGVGLLLHLNDPVRHLYIKQVLNCHNPVVFSSRAGHTMKKMEPHFFFVTLIKYLCQKLNRKFTHNNSWPIFYVPIIFCFFFSSFWTSRLSWMRTSSHSKMSGVSPFLLLQRESPGFIFYLTLNTSAIAAWWSAFMVVWCITQICGQINKKTLS